MPTLDELVSHPPHLPVTHALSDIAAIARPGGCVVITAPSGMGKATLLPPTVAVVLAQHNAAMGRALATRPRGAMARTAARRTARLLGEKIGSQIGYSVCGDSRVSECTHVEMMTPGMALRRLQRDPELPGVSALTIDEFHERDLDTNLTPAFALDARLALRNGLFVALTSAALEALRTVDFLRVPTGGESALINIPEDIFPLKLRHAPPPRDVEAVDAIGDEHVDVRRRYLAHVVRTAEEMAATARGSVLVLLPGVSEIETVRGDLRLGDIPTLALHRQLSTTEQGRTLSPASGRRVILPMSIAGPSLMVPGVSVVVDAGLAREPHFDAGRSLSSLVTVLTALARLEQRAGRVARADPGIAVYVMDAMDMTCRPAQSTPGVATQSLTDARLQVASWDTSVEELSLLDVPPAGTREAARQRPSPLGVVDEAGVTTALSHTLASPPLDPPLGRALLAPSALLGASEAVRFMALLSEDLRVPGTGLGAFERRLSRGGASDAGGTHAQVTQVKETQTRLERLAQRLPASAPDDPLASVMATHQQAGSRTREDELALTCTLACPEWITRRRAGSVTYILAGGVGTELPQGSPLEGQGWLAMASIGRAPASRHARILAVVPLSGEDALAAGVALLETRTQVDIDRGILRATRTHALGAIPLKGAPVSSLSEDEAVALVADHLAARGLGDLGWGKEASSLRRRMRMLHDVLGNPWPDVSDETLTYNVHEWLLPQARRLVQDGFLSNVSMLDALRSMLPWPDAARLSELASEKMPIPAGGTCPIDWNGVHPVLIPRTQQTFE